MADEWTKYWRLEFMDGSSDLVVPPPVLGATAMGRPLMVGRLLRGYHGELSRALEGKRIWPLPEPAGHPDDSAFYALLAPWYQKIAALLTPPFDPGRLDPLSRHEFFICTAPVSHPATGEQVRGLCGLEQLLGLAYVAGPVEDGGDGNAIAGTGDPDLDALTYASLTFKEADVTKLAGMLSAADLSRMASYGNELYRKSATSDSGQDSSGESRDKAEAMDDDELFRENCDRILAKLKALEIPVPDGFC